MTLIKNPALRISWGMSIMPLSSKPRRSTNNKVRRCRYPTSYMWVVIDGLHGLGASWLGINRKLWL
ncbi:hypothetical protein BJY04DRAFT_175558 [Aspergillus karnatakaensis]|uniref:uncharacterized protein n=1 Tax=Aspergillus karnatakaensis TaxID=1810916 RepID=UPI003CCE219B